MVPRNKPHIHTCINIVVTIIIEAVNTNYYYVHDVVVRTLV